MDKIDKFMDTLSKREISLGRSANRGELRELLESHLNDVEEVERTRGYDQGVIDAVKTFRVAAFESKQRGIELDVQAVAKRAFGVQMIQLAETERFTDTGRVDRILDSAKAKIVSLREELVTLVDVVERIAEVQLELSEDRPSKAEGPTS